MTGAQHYREAELLIETARQHGGANPAAQIVAEAQVHATLAVAAATVADRGIGPEETSGWRALHPSDDWREVTS